MYQAISRIRSITALSDVHPDPGAQSKET
jgi:hypothetical protein